MTGSGLQCSRIIGPRVIRVFRTYRWLRHYLNLRHTLTSLAMSRSYTVTSRVTTSDDEHILAFCRDTLLLCELHTGQYSVLLREQFQGKVYTFQLTAWDFKVSCRRCTRGNYNSICIAYRFKRFYFHAEAELNTFLFKKSDTTVYDSLVQFEIRNAIA